MGYTSPGIVDGIGFAFAESADVCGVAISFTNGPIGAAALVDAAVAAATICDAIVVSSISTSIAAAICCVTDRIISNLLISVYAVFNSATNATSSTGGKISSINEVIIRLYMAISAAVSNACISAAALILPRISVATNSAVAASAIAAST